MDNEKMNYKKDEAENNLISDDIIISDDNENEIDDFASDFDFPEEAANRKNSDKYPEEEADAGKEELLSYGNNSVKEDTKSIKGKISLRQALITAVTAVVVIGAFAVAVKLFINSNPLKYSSADEAIDAAEQLVTDSNDLQGAIAILDTNMQKDSDGKMFSLREQYWIWLKETKLSEADAFVRQGDYINAANAIKPLAEADSETYFNMYDTYSRFASSIVKWDGVVEHIAFNSLIYDAANTFTGDERTRDFEQNYLTTEEFKRLLDKLYESGYILYDIHRLYSVNGDGTTERNEVYVPQGKKPLVMTFDDITYHDYLKPYGFVEGMDTDDDGNVRTYITTNAGVREYIEEGDFVPIIENYIAAHPDFSFAGARATISLTGYDGILGYRTNKRDAANHESMCMEARNVAERLKALGWTFASQSYDNYSFDEQGYEWFAEDSAKWNSEISPLIGGTDIYIYPHGVNPPDISDERVLKLREYGFDMFCGNAQASQLEFYEGAVSMQRIFVGGDAIRNGTLSVLVDTSGVLDTASRTQ